MNASLAEIKSSFRNKARELHPDKNIGKDTTIQMQELNDAYQVLIDPKSRAEYDLKLNAYFFKKAEKPREDDNFIYEEASGPHQSYNFFSTHQERTFRVDKWCAKYNSFHLFIDHPKLHGCKDNITFWNQSNSPKVSMPINFNQELRQQLRTKLLLIIPLSSSWPCDNDVEIMIKLPKDLSSLNAVLDIVFEAYNLPAQLSDFVRKKMGFSLNVTFTI